MPFLSRMIQQFGAASSTLTNSPQSGLQAEPRSEHMQACAKSVLPPCMPGRLGLGTIGWMEYSSSNFKKETWTAFGKVFCFRLLHSCESCICQMVGKALLIFHFFKTYYCSAIIHITEWFRLDGSLKLTQSQFVPWAEVLLPISLGCPEPHRSCPQSPTWMGSIASLGTCMSSDEPQICLPGINAYSKVSGSI